MNDQLRQSLQSLRIDRREDGPADGAGASPRRRFRRLPAILLLALLAAAAAVVWGGRPLAVETAKARPASPATLAAAGGWVPVLNASGYVVARRQATVSSKITGRIAEILVEEGLRVEQDQVLARLDDAEVRRSLALAEAQLDAARAARRETEVRLAQARRDLQRTAKLVEDGIGSAADLDAIRAEADSLEARLAAAGEQVKVATRAVAVERQQLENTVIRAPFAGVAISKNAQPGEMISPVSAGGGFTRTGVSTVVDMASLEVEVDVNENYIQRVRAGQRIEARLNAYPDWKIPGSVITTVPAADRESATVRVRIALDALDPRILPEMGVKVAFLAEGSEAAALVQRVEIPVAALRQEGQETFVFTVREGKAARRKIEVAARHGDWALLASGVGLGDEVVVGGPSDLGDGRRVEARAAAAAGAP